MLPEQINDVNHLEDLLSEPTEGVIDALSRMDGDLMVLGVGGKMGPSLARMALRAFRAAGKNNRVIGVSRFTSPDIKKKLSQWDIEVISCDLLDEKGLASLPDVPNIVFMVGMKFGTVGQEWMTWAVNTMLPAMVCSRFRWSNFVVFSTGNVYPLTQIVHGGSVETDTLSPIGEYAMSCLGRERVFEYFSREHGTKVAIVRLNYAVELRYGVLVDLARKVLNGELIDLTMGAVNVIWQGDAVAMALQCFSHVSSPPFVINITGPETLSVRRVCEWFGRLMNRSVTFIGAEAQDALLSNAQMAHMLFGYPRVSVGRMVKWIADWLMRGGEVWDKPTHFEERHGRF
ncbi:MAG: NAD-dependent epimerase/dehydratase family protein [Armatimonadota bacterium]|nr:NAD-dependent epimerase/dehydratase family protein [Armatimonadota bacterium]MCX7777258.1 NAD-dependent epimerase/dehydratase family protein [Armatimonadota bacterium]MDW8024673.1 NAD-dependent epimerase/dehydratase family protein [Armatimonadota bacterium]